MFARIFLTLVLSLFLIEAAPAQTKDAAKRQKDMEKANEYYRNYDFPKAIKLYKDLAEQGSKTAVRKIADAYRMMNDVENAALYYEQVVREENINEKYYFYYAQSLMGNGQYEEAGKWFREYLKHDPGNALAIKMEEACRQADGLLPATDVWELIHLPLNTEASEFGPSFFKEGILFSSSRIESLLRKKDGWTNSGYLDMYYTPVRWGDTLNRDERIRGAVNTFSYHDGPGCASKDERLLYFTRNNVVAGTATASRSGEVKLKIFSAEKSGDQYKNIKELGFNGNEYSCAYPSLDPSEKRLYFSSDKGGGYGGTDIYYSDFDAQRNRWLSPVNVGPEVNTAGDERFPFIHASGRLYFSSNGHLGLGGLDIFEASPAGEDGRFTNIQNLGRPFNSEKDDFSYIIDEGRITGFFASNRNGGAGSDDIYQFTSATVPVRITAVRADSTAMVCGYTAVEASTKKIEAFGKTSNQQEGRLTRLRPETTYILTVEKLGYQTKTLPVTTGKAFEPMDIVIVLEPTDGLPAKPNE